MAVFTLLASSMVMSAMALVQGPSDDLWEICCSSESWLTQACERDGLRCLRVNLYNNLDVYKPSTWERLKDLAKVRKPKRLWMSFPCTKWCPWNRLNFAGDRWYLLELLRRKERAMLNRGVDFLIFMVDNYPGIEIYWEWPRDCEGWHQHVLQRLQRELLRRGLLWEPVRIDGCRYGLRDRNNENLVLKRWIIRTTNPKFVNHFHNKTCTGDHVHTPLAGSETARSAYYPWKLCQSIAKFWQGRDKWERRLKYLSVKDDGMNESEFAALVYDLCPAESSAEPTEAEKEDWRHRVAHFHKAAGHPTNRNLVRMMQDGQLPKWKVDLAMEHKCPQCEEHKPGGDQSGQVPNASTNPLPEPWTHVGLDVGEWPVPEWNLKVKFVLYVDLATKMKVVDVLLRYPFHELKTESADAVIKSFSLHWLARSPKPLFLIPDNAKSLRARVCRILQFNQHLLWTPC